MGSDPQARDSEAEFWDGRYAEKELVWSAGPNQFLPAQVDGVSPGRAVDLGCGEGRNAIWLAEQGWQVTGVDFSEVAIDKATQIAMRRGVAVDWVCADATSWQPPPQADSPNGFDLAVAFYLQLPSGARTVAVTNASRLLQPGGLLVVIAHDSANLTHGYGGPQDPAILYTAAEVVRDLESTGIQFDIEQAGTVERNVEGAGQPALDCVVRVRRRT